MTTTHAIKVQNLSFAYPDGTLALDDVSFEIAHGERVGIIGINGAGKTTLILHFNGILNGGKGEVQILGMEPARENLKVIRRQVGLVFQNPDDQLFCPTVYDDVAFGPRNMGLPENEVQAIVRKSLAAVGLEGTEGRSAFHLSLGQKKRAAIATVLATDSKVLVLDEPTSNLDPRARRLLADLLRGIEGTQIIVTHDLQFLRGLCSRILIISAGKLVADLPAARILDDQQFLTDQGLA